MGDLKTSVVIDLSGNLAAKGRQFGQELTRLGQTGSRSMRLLSSGVSAASRGLDTLGNRYTALITGAAGVGAVRQVANLEQRFARLGIQAKTSAAEMATLKKQIFEAAKAPDIRVDPGQITAAIEEIVEKTGDLAFARENIRSIGLAIQATGAEGLSIGGIMAEFQKMGLDAKDSFAALETLTAQGKEGAFTLQNLAALGPRVVTAYTAMGRGGLPAIREMGAALQVIRQGTGSSEMAATAFEAMLRTLGDAKKVKILQAGGLQIFDPEQAKLGKEVVRPINELMVDIIRKTGGKKTVLSRVFDAEAIRAFNAATAEFQRTGQVQSLEKFYNIQSDGTVLLKDSARAAGTFNAALTSLYIIWQEFADSELAGPIRNLSDALNDLEPGAVERWLQVGKYIAYAGGAAILASKVLQTAGWLKILRRAPAAAGAAVGDAGAVPVRVVNGMNPLHGGRDPFRAPSPTGPAPVAGTGMLLAGGAALAGPALMALVAGASESAGKALARKEARSASEQTLLELAGRNMVMGGGPRNYQAGLLEAELDRRHGGPVEMQGELKILIDADGRPRLQEMRSSRGLDLDVSVGKMMMTAH